MMCICFVFVYCFVGFWVLNICSSLGFGPWFCLNVLGRVCMYMCVYSLGGLAFDLGLWFETDLKLFLTFGIHGFWDWTRVVSSCPGWVGLGGRFRMFVGCADGFGG